MKTTIFILSTAFIVFFASCNQNGSGQLSHDDSIAIGQWYRQQGMNLTASPIDTLQDTITVNNYSTFIPCDKAYEMIERYQNENAELDHKRFSYLVKKESLLEYLNVPGVEYVKIFHAYRDEEHAAADAPTLIIACLKQTPTGYEYVFFDENMLLNNMLPCPRDCSVGTMNITCPAN